MKVKRTNKIMCLIMLLTVLMLSVAIVASASGEIVSGGETVSTTYGYNSELKVPSRYFTLNGTNYQASTTLTYPKGRQTTFQKAVLDEIGEYTLT